MVWELELLHINDRKTGEKEKEILCRLFTYAYNFGHNDVMYSADVDLNSSTPYFHTRNDILHTDGKKKGISENFTEII